MGVSIDVVFLTTWLRRTLRRVEGGCQFMDEAAVWRSWRNCRSAAMNPAPPTAIRPRPEPAMIATGLTSVASVPVTAREIGVVRFIVVKNVGNVAPRISDGT